MGLTTVTISYDKIKPLHTQNEAILAYNIEFAEVTGGTFWKAYTQEQLAGGELFQASRFGDLADLMQRYPPVDLYDEKLRAHARALGSRWVRVSGTWATKTYYDMDGTTGGVAPDGFLNVLTRAQWTGVLDFVKNVGAKLLVSVSGCPGVYGAHGAPVPSWTPKEAEKLFRFSADYNVPIAASEFINEPYMPAYTGFPAGYTAGCFARDQSVFRDWLKANYPECLYVGPCAGGEGVMGKGEYAAHQRGESRMIFDGALSVKELMGDEPCPLDVFSYHYYNGVSERLANTMPEKHWSVADAHTEAYLDVAMANARIYSPFRDKYCPGGDMWVTESGDSAGGGNTWGSAYLDVIRTLNEAGGFSRITKGLIFHNTLAASDYAFLDRTTHCPRPNYYAALLWNALMGTTVYDCGVQIREGAHVYAQSRRDARPGYVFLLINNSAVESTTFAFPTRCEAFVLSAKDGNPRSREILINGVAPDAEENADAAKLLACPVVLDKLKLAPLTCAFVLAENVE